MQFNRRHWLCGLSLALVAGAPGLIASGWEDPPRPSPLELRIAEERAAEGLIEASVPGSSEKIYLRPMADLTKADVADVKATQDDRKSPQVEVVFTNQGSAKMRKLTSENTGKRLAILVGGKVVTAPTIRSTISDRAVITGRFTAAEVEQMVATIVGTK